MRRFCDILKPWKWREVTQLPNGGVAVDRAGQRALPDPPVLERVHVGVGLDHRTCAFR